MKFPEFQKQIHSISARYGCENIVMYHDCDDYPGDKWIVFPAITINLGRFEMDIDVDARWGGVLRFNFFVSVTKTGKDEPDLYGLAFPRKNYPQYLPQGVKYYDCYYQIPVTMDDWQQKMHQLLIVVLENRKALEDDCERVCYRDKNGNSKKQWKEWKSSAKIIRVENMNSGGVIQGIKKDKQADYDCSPYCAGSNGSYRFFGENEWVMTVRVKRFSQDYPPPRNYWESIERFMKQRLLPAIGRQRVSSNLKEDILKQLQKDPLTVVTKSFGSDGIVSEDATFLPVGFRSWDDYLETVFKDWLQYDFEEYSASR